MKELRDLCYQIYPNEHFRLTPEHVNLDVVRDKWWKEVNEPKDAHLFITPPIFLDSCGPCMHSIIPQLNEVIKEINQTRLNKFMTSKERRATFIPEVEMRRKDVGFPMSG